MDIETMQARAVDVRRQFAAFEEATYGHEWNVEDLVMGLMTDLGDLAAIVQTLEGKRPPREDDPIKSLEHEVSDCLWVLLVIADRYGINTADAFDQTMTGIESWIRANGPNT